MSEKKTKKKTKTKTTTKQKQKQSQKQSVVVNVNTSSKRTRKKKNTESAGTQRGNFAGRQISNGIPNNVIVHNNIDTAELVKVFKQQPVAQTAPVSVGTQNLPPITINNPPQNLPPITINNTPRVNTPSHHHYHNTTPLSIVPENHRTPTPNIFNAPVNTTPENVEAGMSPRPYFSIRPSTTDEIKKRGRPKGSRNKTKEEKEEENRQRIHRQLFGKSKSNLKFK